MEYTYGATKIGPDARLWMVRRWPSGQNYWQDEALINLPSEVADTEGEALKLALDRNSWS